MFEFKFTKGTLLALPLLCTTQVFAGEADVVMLESRVNEQVSVIENTGLLPTYVEVEAIMGDIIAHEIATTRLTVDEAVEKYQLTPTLERYVRIKGVGVSSVSSGEIQLKPPPPPPPG